MVKDETFLNFFVRKPVHFKIFTFISTGFSILPVNPLAPGGAYILLIKLLSPTVPVSLYFSLIASIKDFAAKRRLIYWSVTNILRFGINYCRPTHNHNITILSRSYFYCTHSISYHIQHSHSHIVIDTNQMDLCYTNITFWHGHFL